MPNEINVIARIDRNTRRQLAACVKHIPANSLADLRELLESDESDEFHRVC